MKASAVGGPIALVEDGDQINFDLAAGDLTLHVSDPVWQSRYYGFNLWSRRKVEEELDDMHLNPVRAGLAERTVVGQFAGNASVGNALRGVPPERGRRTTGAERRGGRSLRPN